jgi:aspartate/methionine/tyrosine aminotransferase
LNQISTTILGKRERLAAPIRAAMSELEPHLIAEVASLALGDPKVIPLWFGESDVPTPRFIRDAAKSALDEGMTFYTHTRGIPPLRDALAGYLSGLYGRTIGADRISVTTAGMNAIMLGMQLALDAGDNAVLVTPLWPNASAAVEIMGAEPRAVMLEREQGRWRLDLDKLFDTVDARTRVLFINSPGNPTGWMMPHEQQVEVLKFCRARNIWLMADEVYHRIVYHGRAAPSFLEIAEPDDPVLVANSFSKAWAMTGWRMGWLTAPPALGDLLGELIQHNVSGVPTFLQPAAIKALNDGEPFVAEMVERCRRGRDIVANHLAEMSRVRFTAPDAAFYAFFEVEGVDDSVAFAKRIVREAEVGLAPGAAFGKGGGAFLRLCFAQAPELLERAMERLKRVLSWTR